MKSLNIIFIFIIMHSFNMAAQDLSDFQWKSRIVILYENDTNFKNVKNALEIIDNNASILTERDILVFVYKDHLYYNTNRTTTV
ncbi:hypothetical protein [Maribacter spongiicola]|uniref:hypothetical protein n=1 Tax=Maribacter spongiicola TaxID=1206753 RepID=UPI003F9A6B67